MRTLKTSIVTLAMFVCLASLSLGQDSQVSQDSKYKDLPNFHQVNPNLYRGGQPGKGGLQQLRQLGVKAIINLRDDDERARAEAAEAQALGLRYFNIPFASFDRPGDKDVDAVLKLIDSLDNQPVFVHCKRGSDRTGTIIAIYRIEHDGWNSEKAKEEANRYGLGFWEVKMKDYIHDYYERRTLRNGDIATPTQKPNR